MENSVKQKDDMQMAIDRQNAIPSSTFTLSDAVAKGLSPDTTSNAEHVFDRCMASVNFQSGSVPMTARMAIKDAIHRAVFDAYSLGRNAGKLEAERMQLNIGHAADRARSDAISSTWIAVTMDAAGMTEMTVDNADIATVWDRVTLRAEYAGERATYKLGEKVDGCRHANKVTHMDGDKREFDLCLDCGAELIEVPK